MEERDRDKTIPTREERAADYSVYLELDTLLSLQRPLSDPQHHDELLFIVQHQVTELWIKLILHELAAAMGGMRAGNLQRALKHLRRITHIQEQITSQWAVMDTLTPTDYAGFRGVFSSASGLQSPQFRLFEFLLGKKNSSLLDAWRPGNAWRRKLEAALHAPALFDEFLMYLARCGLPVPEAAVARDFSEPRAQDPRVVDLLKGIYDDPDGRWSEYETCERFVDIANHFEFWRFRHMKSVERIIGHKAGTGGSSGVPSLRRTLEAGLFPELTAVRGAIGVDESAS